MLLSQLSGMVIMMVLSHHRPLEHQESQASGAQGGTGDQELFSHPHKVHHLPNFVNIAARRRQPFSNRTLLPPSSYRKSQERLLVHLHIGKNGGTSIDSIGRGLAKQTNRHYVPKGHFHFDWAYIVKLPQDKIDVITMLRHPVARAVSHFYYAKPQPWTVGTELRSISLHEYLQGASHLLRSRIIWADGQAATWWLTGTHIGSSWVVNVDASDVPEREEVYRNATAMCHLAADRLDQTFWFGMLEDLPRSMELLQHALKLPRTPSLPQRNAGKTHHPKPTEWEEAALASLMPRDLWVYEYGKVLFEARYHAMQTGAEFVVLPERPPIPDMWTCTSTRTRLECNTGPFKGSYERPNDDPP
jgi:hypothetical protein